MTYRISKEFAFSASHQLRGLHEGHPCARLHGHNYVVRVELASDRLDSTGFVLDYSALKPFGAWLDAHLDHRHLNEAFPGSNPTAETLARTLAGVLADVVALPDGAQVAVSVSETPKTWATWTFGALQ